MKQGLGKDLKPASSQEDKEEQRCGETHTAKKTTCVSLSQKREVSSSGRPCYCRVQTPRNKRVQDFVALAEKENEGKG